MSLTVQALPIVLGVCATVIFVLLVLGRPRFNREWARATQRGLGAALLNASVLGLVFVLVNNQYSFYVSWDDLLGARQPVTTTHRGGPPKQAGTAAVTGRGLETVTTPAVLPALPRAGSREQVFQLTGERSRIRSTVVVYLPAGYDPGAQRTYPVIVALHGFPGHARNMFAWVSFQNEVDTAVRRHQLAAPIIVAPQINNPPEIDTEAVNAPGGLQSETWLAEDVPHWVATHFRVKKTRGDWSVFGYSLGGWGAAMLSMRHPDVFGSAIIMQGYFQPTFEAPYIPFGPDSPSAKEYDLVQLSKLNPPPVALWVLASKQDSLSYPSTARLAEQARSPLSITLKMLKTGGHRNTVWQPWVLPSLQWLGSTKPVSTPDRRLSYRPTQPVPAALPAVLRRR